MKMLIVLVASVAAVWISTAVARPTPYNHAERACTARGGSFGVQEGGGYYCNFGGEAPKNWYGATYEKTCAAYGGTIYEEYPPPYSYTCTIP
jgi:hypothetical protein